MKSLCAVLIFQEWGGVGWWVTPRQGWRNVSWSVVKLKKKEGFLQGEGHSSPELVFARIFSEAHRVLIQYETAHKKPVTSIILTGGGGVTKELGTYAKNLFSIDVQVADPFIKTEAPAFMRPILEEIGPEFAVAVGLALRKLDEI